MAVVIVAALLAAPASGKVVIPHFPERIDNGCVAIKALGTGGRFLTYANGTYRATATRLRDAERFWFKPTDLNFGYMLYDREGRLMSRTGRALTAQATPGPSAEWFVIKLLRYEGVPLGRGKFELSASEDGALRFRKLGTAFRLVSAKGCTPYPEAGPGATGRPFRGTNPDGTVFGFADTHLHITANLRAGGRVIHGEPFDRFGITEALGHDEDDHGADGSQDVTGNLLRTGLPFGTHDTHGWPTFAGWPTNDTNTHQQVYYSWLQRAYDSGLRFVVAQTVEDQPICRIEPMRSHSCNEMHTIKLEVHELEGLQDYVDAQSGGPGQGGSASSTTRVRPGG